MGDKQSLRDRLRASTVGAAKDFGGVTVDVGDEKVIVRKPSVRKRADIIQRAKKGPGKSADSVDIATLQVWAVIELCYDEEGEQVFEAGDADNMMNSPAGGWFDELYKVALSQINVDAEEKAKN